MTKGQKISFRDVSLGLQKFRDFLLGRKNVYHNRFPPLISPRSIPPPDIPRGPDDRYSNQAYFRRSPYVRVKPPVVGPIAEGLKKGDGTIKFDFPPTPGPAWWWDSHCYYEIVEDIINAPPKQAFPPPPPPPKPCTPPEMPTAETKGSGVCDPCKKP